MFRPHIGGHLQGGFFRKVYYKEQVFFIYFQYILVLCNLDDKASIKLLGIFIIIFVLVSLIATECV